MAVAGVVCEVTIIVNGIPLAGKVKLSCVSELVSLVILFRFPTSMNSSHVIYSLKPFSI